jgi:hypothetical protein
VGKLTSDFHFAAENSKATVLAALDLKADLTP